MLINIKLNEAINQYLNFDLNWNY